MIESALVVWLNVYGAANLSLPASSYDACKRAMQYYVQHKDVYAAECSHKPIPHRFYRRR